MEHLLGPELKIVGRLPALMHLRSSTVIISDVHLGYEDSMASQGVFLPKLQLRRAKEVIAEGARLGARRVIVNGDLKHVFEKLTRGEKLEITELIHHTLNLGIKELIVIRGNHDTFVAPLLKDFGVELVEDYMELEGGIVLTHGHRLVEGLRSGTTVIIGHEHPSLEISLAGAKVKLQALLRAPLKDGGTLIVLPAVSLYQTGTSITTSPDTYLSPITKQAAELENAVPIIIDREIGVVELPPLAELLR